jgi:hypothetical protein
MNITRERKQYDVEVPTIDSLAEAKIVFNEVVNNRVTPKNKRDAANGLIEAFVVSTLRDAPKTNGALLKAIKNVQAELPKCNAVSRALLRVKDFRGKNPAWKSVTI